MCTSILILRRIKIELERLKEESKGVSGTPSRKASNRSIHDWQLTDLSGEIGKCMLRYHRSKDYAFQGRLVLQP